jgi:predicted Zn finger-like uncharacterized protein
MKISCQSCAAKYTIADEKVVGKVIKLKCKKCSSTIVVNGNDPGVLAQLQAQTGGDAGGFDDQAATQLLSQPPQLDMGGGNPDEWTVSVTDDDQRTMTTAQILTEYAKGALNADTYIWKDGMGDWLPIHQVPDLAPLLSAGSPAPSNNGGLGQHQPSDYGTPMAAAAATGAAARKPRSSNVDLFGGGGGGLEQVGFSSASTNMEPPPGLGDKHVGERNETSVLFSLKDLAAAEASAAQARPSEKRNAFANRNDRVDDIFSLGGMSAASPMLAPPPLNAPIIEPPPPPPSVAPMMAAMAPMSYAQPQKKSAVPFIVGGLGALALVGGIVFFVMAGGSDAKPDDTKKVAEKTAESGKPTDSAKPADSSLIAATTDSAGLTASASATESAVASAETSASADPKAVTTGGKVALVDPKKDDPKKEDPKKEDPKKEDPKKEDPKAAGGDTPFDRGAASAALSGAAGGAKGCKKADGPTGSTKVQVTFAPSGKATQATVGPPFAGTPTGSCIAGAFRGLSVPPFSGAPMTVSKTVNIK